MNKYQLYEMRPKKQHAGSKARDDASFFAEEAGYKPLNIKCCEISDSIFGRLLRRCRPFMSYLSAYHKIENNSIVLLQNPFYYKQFGREKCISMLKNKKNCTIVSLIHDVEFLRGSNWKNTSTQPEFEFMKATSDYFIVHNDSMKAEFIKNGFDEKSLISLDIFDYRVDGELKAKPVDENTPDVIVAGNLNPIKSPYVYLLNSPEVGVPANLYGPNFEGDKDDKLIKYNGSFPSDKIPEIIEGKFGLIWDGDSITGCNGETGRYLRYNNPHKTSLYLVSRHPVIIWKEAAMAKFVERENVGITVDSLSEIREKIDAVSSDEYNKMLENTEKVAEKLEKGYYLKSALEAIEKNVSGK